MTTITTTQTVTEALTRLRQTTDRARIASRDVREALADEITALSALATGARPYGVQTIASETKVTERAIQALEDAVTDARALRDARAAVTALPVTEAPMTAAALDAAEAAEREREAAQADVAALDDEIRAADRVLGIVREAGARRASAALLVGRRVRVARVAELVRGIKDELRRLRDGLADDEDLGAIAERFAARVGRAITAPEIKWPAEKITEPAIVEAP